MSWDEISKNHASIDDCIMTLVKNTTIPFEEIHSRLSIVLTEPISFRDRLMVLSACIDLEPATYSLRLCEEEGDAFVDVNAEYIEYIIEMVIHGAFIPLHNVETDKSLFDQPIFDPYSKRALTAHIKIA